MDVLQCEFKGTGAFNALLMPVLHAAYSRGGSFSNPVRKSEALSLDEMKCQDDNSSQRTAVYTLNKYIKRNPTLEHEKNI